MCGVNEVGVGEPSWTSGTTLAPPPQPPQLICSEAGSNYLKLKWKPAGNANASSSSNFYYYLEKENDNGKFSPVSYTFCLHFEMNKEVSQSVCAFIDGKGSSTL